MDNEITPEEVKAKLHQNEAFTWVDVREPWDVATAAIAGAMPMPMGEVPPRAHQELDPESRWSCFAITE